MKRTVYSPLPCSSYDPAEEGLTVALALHGRASVVRAQAETWLFAHEQVRVDPELRAELERARAGRQAPITCDKAAIVRACIAGAVAPDEAVELFRRTQG